jgi:hypothetical protein
MSEPLTIYLNDHLMGATGGLELFRRAAASLPAVAPMVAEVEQDRDALRAMLAAVGGRPDPVKVAAGWAGEKAGRLKLNGRLLSRSPLSDLVELEALALAVQGKLGGWRLLASLGDPRLAAHDLDGLIARAQDQYARLEQLRLARGREVLRGA